MRKDTKEDLERHLPEHFTIDKHLAYIIPGNVSRKSIKRAPFAYAFSNSESETRRSNIISGKGQLEAQISISFSEGGGSSL